ncbi:solute carrier family 26 member 9-like [Thalassophryne amazonica]|uniref:solute carrier family 26 member 9-like n=1 Tax=Thalassophryne amazonica TaxID=390379 RepID=UPI0014718920|nr:solute carrier family 26 member 9-like [Thalassophryne amazonica]
MHLHYNNKVGTMQKDSLRYVIDRPAYTLPDFDKQFDKKSRQFPLGDKVKKKFRCSAAKLKALLFRRLPILKWLPKYKVKEKLLHDVISGVYGGTIQVTQGMASALLGELPPVNGLYSSFFPLFPYLFLGTSHLMVLGTLALFSVMVGSVCLQLAPESDFSYFNTTLNATIVDTDRMYEARMRISGTLMCLTGVIQLGLSLTQFGFIAIYLSDSLIRGFLTAVGIKIFIGMLKFIFGLKVPPFKDPAADVFTLIHILTSILETNVASLLFAVVTIVVLVPVKLLSERYRHKLPFPIPVHIIIVIVATAISGSLNLPEIYHMDVVGEVPLGIQAPVLPQVSMWSDMLGPAFSLAILGYVSVYTSGRMLSALHGYDVDPNQEMLALGCSNFFGSFFQSQAVSCVLSVTLAIDSGGGTSQIANLSMMLIVLVTLLFLGVYLKPLPKSVLAVMIVVTMKKLFLQLSDPYYLWKKNKLDSCVWVITFLATFLLGITYGIAIGVGFSMLVVVFKTQFRNGSALVQIMDTDIYRNPKMYSQGVHVTGVKIVTYCSPLYFANAELFFQKVIKKTGLDPGKLIMARQKLLKKQQKEKAKEEKKQAAARKKQKKHTSVGQMNTQTTSQLELQEDVNRTDDGTNQTDAPISYINMSYSASEPDEQTPSPPADTLESPPVPFHTLILDLSGVCFIDLMGIKVLIKMNSHYSKLGINLYLAHIQAQVYEDLEAGGAFDDGNIVRNNIFPSVHDAILYAQQHSAVSQKPLEQITETDELALTINDDNDGLQELL